MTQHTLPKLPYSFTALEPFIDATTMEIHYAKHHQAYVDKLNTALASEPDLADKPLVDLLTNLDSVPETIRTAVKNNGGGHYNHSHYWSILSPVPSKPAGKLLDAINSTFTSLDNFLLKYKDAGLSHFGSGWVWLVAKDRGLSIISTANQDTPLTLGYTPLVGIDLWEHAYYLKYQNRRADYLDAIFHVINWSQISL